VTTARWIALLAALSILVAIVAALASRAPESVREAKPGEEALDPSLGARFTDAQIARDGMFRAPGYLSFVLVTILELVTLVALAKGVFASILDVIRKVPGGWWVHALIAGAAVALVMTLVTLPIGYVRGYANATAWGLSTQDVGGWLSDRFKGTAVAMVIAAVSALAFFAVVRWTPRFWWIVGWAAFTVLTVVITFLYPVVVAPIFNKFTPLKDEQLTADIKSLAARAGIEVDKVLVADASRRTTAENAYVAGLGATKQVVLFDTLLSSGGPGDTRFIVAHELGHQKENHVAKNTIIASIGLAIGFAVLAWLISHGRLVGFAGASGLDDLKILPALLLYVAVATLLTLPIENTISRAFEKRADEIGIQLTGDSDAAVRAFRRLAFANLADLRPSRPVVWALFTHPPIPDRIRDVSQPAST
jgi:STE24 endopeptidase